MSMAIASLFGGTNIVTSLNRPHHGRSLPFCRASSGGTRRDHEKILARQQKRRVRHMKGVTPSTPDLIKTLDSEKRDQAKLDQEDNQGPPSLDDAPGVVVTEDGTQVEDDQSSEKTK